MDDFENKMAANYKDISGPSALPQNQRITPALTWPLWKT
jgi:hypothetical protein